jgi:hypothetical protein
MMDDAEIIKWADRFSLAPMEKETLEAFRCRFAWYMLHERHDPIVAAEIILGKTHDQWSPLECAKWVLDYEEWMETNPHSYRYYDIWQHMREAHRDALNQIIFMERRREGKITSNPVECTTLDGRHAADVGRWDPSRRGRRTHWDRNILKDAPHGYEEAVLKRERFPVDDPDQGPLLIRHLDKDGRSQVKQIIPKREQIVQLPSLYPRPGRRTLAQSGEGDHDHQALEEHAASCKKVDG